MSVFVDTSAFYALLVENDKNHARATSAWKELCRGGTPAVSSSYVVLETCALLQARVGLSAVRAFHQDFRPAVSVEWVDEGVHDTAMDALLAADRRQLSLVDCTSFAIMRRLLLEEAFTFDDHFREQGFICLPGPPGA